MVITTHHNLSAGNCFEPPSPSLNTTSPRASIIALYKTTGIGTYGLLKSYKFGEWYTFATVAGKKRSLVQLYQSLWHLLKLHWQISILSIQQQLDSEQLLQYIWWKYHQLWCCDTLHQTLALSPHLSHRAIVSLQPWTTVGWLAIS